MNWGMFLLLLAFAVVIGAVVAAVYMDAPLATLISMMESSSEEL